jgi:aspartate/methionine/tyrosine aminotransferase
MWFNRMSLEDWFDTYQYEIKYDVGESAIKYLTFDDIDIDLGKLALRYGHHLGLPELREVIAQQYDGLAMEHVGVTTGASEANFAIVAHLVKPEDHVIVEHPNYTSLYEVPRSLGCHVSLLPLLFENKFKPDFDELKSLITPKTKLISLTHPNNPTGSMITEAELREAIKIAETHDIYLLFDETYRELTYGEFLPPAASLSPKVISISSMSKCYGLPGIRIGWLAAQDRKIIEAARAIREQVTITNGSIGEAIALHVLKQKDEFLRKAMQHVRRNFEIVSEWISNQEDVEWVPPEAAVVSLPRLKANTIQDPEALYRLLAEKYKSFVIPGRCFEMDNRHFRLGFGGTSEELKIGLNNIEKAIDEVKESASVKV